MLRYIIQHPVLANVMMLIFIIGGIYTSFNIKKEVFPTIETNTINISISYDNANAEDIEKNIVNKIENKLLNNSDIDDITSKSYFEYASISIDVNKDRYIMLDEIQNEINSLNFSSDIDINISIQNTQRDVLTIMVYGDENFLNLQKKAKLLEKKLNRKKIINEVSELPLYIELIPKFDIEKTLNISYNDLIQNIKNNNVFQTVNTIENEENINVLINQEYKNEYDLKKINILIQNRFFTLEELFDIKYLIDTENSRFFYNGKNSIEISVYSSDKESPIEVSEKVKNILKTVEFETAIMNDRSEMYKDRLHLLLKNAFIGLILVLIVLSIFLEYKLAFWVAVGIPTAFLGGLLLMPVVDISINMITMFAFIITLGIVVDDAIIVGENIYENRLKGMNYLEASINGIEDIFVPLFFAIITNIVAFMPLALTSGVMGEIFLSMFLVVTLVFIISLIEVTIILPNHLSKKSNRSYIGKKLFNLQQIFDKFFHQWIFHHYKHFLFKVIKYNKLVILLGFMILSSVIGFGMSGKLGFSFMPTVESDRAVAQINFENNVKTDKMLNICRTVSQIAIKNINNNYFENFRISLRGNSCNVDMYLVDEDLRNISTVEFNNLWREHTNIQDKDVKNISFRSDLGGPGGGRNPILLYVKGTELKEIEKTIELLKNKMKLIDNIKDIQTSLDRKEIEISLKVNLLGKKLGLNNTSLSQLKNELKIEEILIENETIDIKIQKDKLVTLNDILYTKINNYYIKDLYDVSITKSKNRIEHLNGDIIESISSNLKNKEILNLTMKELQNEIDQLNLNDVQVEFGSEGKDIQENFSSLGIAFIGVLIIIWFLLSILFKSYVLPILVILAIPFGIVGAIIGHIIMGYGLSIISMLGIIALSGIVINDSLVLIDYANKKKEQGQNVVKAIISAGTRRFKPIILTTLTTFVGLFPMILETSVQAKFLIPMAISISFGVLFATLITLILIPAIYIFIMNKN